MSALCAATGARHDAIELVWTGSACEQPLVGSTRRALTPLTDNDPAARYAQTGAVRAGRPGSAPHLDGKRSLVRIRQVLRLSTRSGFTVAGQRRNCTGFPWTSDTDEVVERWQSDHAGAAGVNAPQFVGCRRASSPVVGPEGGESVVPASWRRRPLRSRFLVAVLCAGRA